MAFQISVAVQNAILDSIETTVGISALLTIRSGAPPANCAAANSGTVLATLNLPSDWMNNAASNSKTKLGTWQDTSADASGTAGHFRIHDTTGTTCHMQGTITATGGGGDMTLDNITLAITQVVTINTFTLAASNS